MPAVHRLQGELKELAPESFWGAIAAFFLLQILGTFIFHAFVFYLGSLFTIIWGGAWLVAFMVFQADTIGKIRAFLSKSSLKDGLLSFIPKEKKRLDEFIKFCLSIIFAAIFAAFSLGYYPFPKGDDSIFYLAAFFAFSWLVSGLLSLKAKKENRSVVATGHARIFGFLVGLAFFFVGVFEPEIFYYHGLVGFGVCTMMLSAWLLEDQIK